MSNAGGSLNLSYKRRINPEILKGVGGKISENIGSNAANQGAGSSCQGCRYCLI